jgi:hypothetical protein
MNGVKLCDAVKEITKVCLGLLDSTKKFTEDDKAMAVGHLGRCRECKGEFTPEERGKFVHEFVTTR